MPYYQLGAWSSAWMPENNAPTASSRSLEAMRCKLSQLSEEPESEPFCVIDLGYIHSQYERWQKSLPAVKPFYAVKCNPDIHMIRVLGSLGCGFDCASRSEIELVLEQGIPAMEIIFAHPTKKIPDLIYAQKSGVCRMTFDNEAELRKIKKWFPDAQLILRCFASDPSAAYSLSCKFGASVESSLKLLHYAKYLGLAVTGVSFHVGSGSKDPRAFDEAIQNARRIFDTGLQIGYDMNLLDIGGGFLKDTLVTTAEVIQQSLDRHFRDIQVEFVAEPGRYFVEGALTVACGVIGRRDAAENITSTKEGENTSHMLYLNDGVWGTFLFILFEPGPPPEVLRASGTFYPQTSANDLEKFMLWGPTCDSTDCIEKAVELPKQLTIEDWLYFQNMGAYTTCLSTGFNGFHCEREIIYVSSHPSTDAYLRECCNSRCREH